MGTEGQSIDSRALSIKDFIKLCERAILNTGFLLLGDTSTENFRPIIPNSLRATTFDRMHNLSHPGIKATQKLIGEQFVWPNMRRDIAENAVTAFLASKRKLPDIKLPPYSISEPQMPDFHIYTSTSLVLSPILLVTNIY